MFTFGADNLIYTKKKK